MFMVMSKFRGRGTRKSTGKGNGIKDLIESDESDSSNKKEKNKSRAHKNAVSDSE